MPNANASFEVVAAICGNWWGESNVNPGIWEGLVVCPWNHQYDGHGGYGLGQWTNYGTPTGRCWDLYQYLVSNGYATDSGDGEVAFMMYENYWTPQTHEQSAYQTLNDFLTSSSTDLFALTKEFMYHWEGINDGTLTTRYNNAQAVLAYITANYNDPNITTWYTGNRFLSTSETLNNCVMAARAIIQGVIPPPVPPPGQSNWIYLYRHIQRRRRLII